MDTHVMTATKLPTDSTLQASPRDVASSLGSRPGWADPEDDDAKIAWARALHEAMAPYAEGKGGTYVNYLDSDESDRVRAAYGDHYDRLVAVKRERDPTNLFSRAQNIAPDSEVADD